MLEPCGLESRGPEPGGQGAQGRERCGARRRSARRVDDVARLEQHGPRAGESGVDRAEVRERDLVRLAPGAGREDVARDADRPAPPARCDPDAAPRETWPGEVPAGLPDGDRRGGVEADGRADDLRQTSGDPRSCVGRHGGAPEVDGEEPTALVGPGRDQGVGDVLREGAPRLDAVERPSVRALRCRDAHSRSLGRVDAPRARGVGPHGREVHVARRGEDRERVEVRLEDARDAHVHRGRRGQQLPQLPRPPAPRVWCDVPHGARPLERGRDGAIEGPDGVDEHQEVVAGGQPIPTERTRSRLRHVCSSCCVAEPPAML